MMHGALLSLAFQLGLSVLPARQMQVRVGPSAPDSIRDLRHARAEQASFEFSRRYHLPEGGGSGGRCDIHLGRFCWWYDDVAAPLPPEAKSVSRRREDLISVLDSLAGRHPGDEWIAGMRVHYRIDGGHAASADSITGECRAVSWWCLALAGYAKHVLGNAAAAESAFTRALSTMPADQQCRWRDISVLLPGDTRGRYEKLACDARTKLEERYWMLSRPQLNSAANDWRTEFYVRRVQARLAERAANPQPGAWGDDAAELLLRYGWPVGWSRAYQPSGMFSQPNVIGHDPVPSFAFAPTEAVLDTLASATDDAWNLHERLSESRFAPRLVHRVAPVGLQVARFRRGDSTLVVAAYAVSDDSLGHAATASLGATLADGSTLAAPVPDSTRHASLMLPTTPLLAGVDVADTSSYTLARARILFARGVSATSLALSDLLLYRAGHAPVSTLDSALAVAIPGDTVSRARPVGIYWETYGISESGENLEISVTVVRIDRSWLRGARQRFGLAAPDSPLKLHWSDARPPETGGAAPRAISLDLANQEPGRYRVTVSLTRADGAQASSGREIQLRER